MDESWRYIRYEEPAERVARIVLARPELLDRRPTWGGGRRNYVSVALEPLDDDSIAALVEHLLDGPPADFVRAVVERAEGNPFYAGELARSISERVAALEDPDEAARVVARLRHRRR